MHIHSLSFLTSKRFFIDYFADLQKTIIFALWIIYI